MFREGGCKCAYDVVRKQMQVRQLEGVDVLTGALDANAGQSSSVYHVNVREVAFNADRDVVLTNIRGPLSHAPAVAIDCEIRRSLNMTIIA
jgi:hypothetical protein